MAAVSAAPMLRLHAVAPMRQRLSVAPKAMRHRLRRACSSEAAIPATSSQDGRAASWERTYTAETQVELDTAYA